MSKGFSDAEDLCDETINRVTKKLPEIRDRSVVRSSVIPSTKYSWSGSFDRLANGRTTIDRRGTSFVVEAEGLGTLAVTGA